MRRRSSRGALAFIARMQERALLDAPQNDSSLRYYFGKRNVVSIPDVFYRFYFDDEAFDLDAVRGAYARFEHPTSIRMLEYVDARLWKVFDNLKIVSDAEFRFDRRVSLGTLPIGEMNALAMRAPDDGYIILLNDGLFPLAKAVAEIFCLSLIENDDGFLIPSGENLAAVLDDRRANAQFEELLFAYLAYGSAEGLGVDDIVIGERADRLRISSCLAHSYMAFVLAHEYAHVFHGHLDDDRASFFDDAGGPDARELWGYELSCDAFATAATLYYDAEHMRLGASLGSAGINIFFTLAEMFAAALAPGLPALDFDPKGTHPSPGVRKHVCARKMQAMLTSTDYKVTTEVWDDMAEIFEGLFRNAVRRIAAYAPDELQAMDDRQARRGAAIIAEIERMAAEGFKRDGRRTVIY